MKYIGSVYRPPSEAGSVIIQVTVGCAHNHCTFCSMYKDKAFQVRSEKDVIADLHWLAERFPTARRIFFADGDALVLPTDRLLLYLQTVQTLFPHLERVSSYATVQDLLRKSEDELRLLNEAGLTLLYIGLESGSDHVLSEIHKGITQAEFVNASRKAKRAGMRLSITLISGIGGEAHREAHALESAKAISLIGPDYASFLTLYLEPGAPLFDQWQAGHFTLPTPEEALAEILLFLEHVDAPNCVFRANHASNYLPLKGTLNEDRVEMINAIRTALEHRNYRPEWMRGL